MEMPSTFTAALPKLGPFPAIQSIEVPVNATVTVAVLAVADRYEPSSAWFDAVPTHVS